MVTKITKVSFMKSKIVCTVSFMRINSNYNEHGQLSLVTYLVDQVSEFEDSNQFEDSEKPEDSEHAEHLEVEMSIVRSFTLSKQVLGVAI